MEAESQPSALTELVEAIDDMAGVNENAIQEVGELAKSTGKWLFFTLSALNSGGIIATITAEKSLESPRLVGAIFGAALASSIGAAFSVMMVAILQAYYLDEIDKVRRKWKDLPDQAELKRLRKLQRKLRGGVKRLKGSLRWYILPVVLAMLSGILFFAASVLFIINYGAVEGRTALFCATLEEDMIKPEPTRANGPDLFEALGCDPTGTSPGYRSHAQPPLRRFSPR